MKAKDTVIKITKPIVDEYSHTEKYTVGDVDNSIIVREKEWDLDRLLQSQAKISFKAGMEYGNQKSYEIGVEEGKVIGIAEGIKEVVSKIGEFCYIWHDENNKAHISIDMKLWKDQLKEWGM